MDLKDIYTGKPVKATKEEGTFEVLRIDEFSETVWCIKLNSIDFQLKEFRVNELKEL